MYCLSTDKKRELKLCSLNIGGLNDKLQDQAILNFILEYDIVWILEAKNYFNLSVPGVITYKNVSSRGHRRGGVMMFLKDWLTQDIMNVGTNIED